MIPVSTDSAILAKAYHNVAVHKMDSGNEKQAEELFIHALQLTPQHPSYRTLAQLSELYIKTGREVLADSLYKQIGNISDLSVKAGIYVAKYQECQKREQYKEAFYYAKLYIAVADSFYNNRWHKEVLEVQKKYDHVELLYQKSQIQFRWLFTLFLFVITIGGLAYIFWYYKKKNNQKYCKLQSEIVMLQKKFMEANLKSVQQDTEIILLQEQIEQKKKELEVLHKRMKLMFGSNNQLLNHDDLKAMQVAFKIMESRMCLKNGKI